MDRSMWMLPGGRPLISLPARARLVLPTPLGPSITTPRSGRGARLPSPTLPSLSSSATKARIACTRGRTASSSPGSSAWMASTMAAAASAAAGPSGEPILGRPSDLLVGGRV